MQKQTPVCRREDAELAVSELMRALAYDTQRGTAPDVRRNFFDGKSAIYIDGVWANTELAETTTKQEIRYAAFPGFSGETIAYANPATGYVISNDGSERQIDACVRFLKYMLSKDVQEQIVTKTHQAPSNPNISDAWIHEQVPVLADAVQVCKQADLQILTLYSVLPAKTSAQLEQQLEELNQNITSIAAQNAAGLLKLHNPAADSFFARGQKSTTFRQNVLWRFSFFAARLNLPVRPAKDRPDK